MNGTHGLLVFVYRSGSDCTNGGISSRYDKLILLMDDGPFTPSEHVPAVKLVNVGCYFHVVPATANVCDNGFSDYMFGGNFVYTCDGRFPSRQPIAIHDRLE